MALKIDERTIEQIKNDLEKEKKLKEIKKKRKQDYANIQTDMNGYGLIKNPVTKKYEVIIIKFDLISEEIISIETKVLTSDKLTAKFEFDLFVKERLNKDLGGKIK